MRSFLVAFAGLMLFATGAAQANVSITVDKNAQLMTVAVDGVERYQWPVSTGLPSHETPNGSFRTFRMEEDHYSKEFDDAPMPHSIFFTKIGHAIHGTDSESRLGTPASHGCVRLSRANASTLYALVEREGVLNTTVTLTGSSQIALARNPRTRANTAVARRDPAEPYAPQYNAAGDPVVLTPQRRAPGQYVRRSGPMTATSIRPTAAWTRRAIRRRAAAGASMTRRPIRGSNITTTAAMRPRRRSTRRGRITSRAGCSPIRTSARAWPDRARPVLGSAASPTIPCWRLHRGSMRQPDACGRDAAAQGLRYTIS